MIAPPPNLNREHFLLFQICIHQLTANRYWNVICTFCRRLCLGFDFRQHGKFSRKKFSGLHDFHTIFKNVVLFVVVDTNFKIALIHVFDAKKLEGYASSFNKKISNITIDSALVSYAFI